jgi:hypothetical protein
MKKVFFNDIQEGNYNDNTNRKMIIWIRVIIMILLIIMIIIVIIIKTMRIKIKNDFSNRNNHANPETPERDNTSSEQLNNKSMPLCLFNEFQKIKPSRFKISRFGHALRSWISSAMSSSVVSLIPNGKNNIIHWSMMITKTSRLK